MKINFADLKKAIDYIAKNGDSGKIYLQLSNFGTVKDLVTLEFNTPDGDKVIITLPTDERSFPSITRNERF